MRGAHGGEFEITVFWNVVCNFADGYQSSGGTCCFYLQDRERSSTLIMETAFAAETLVSINQTSSHHIPENHYLDLTVCEYYIVERCCELGNEPDVMGAGFIYQLNDYHCPRNLATWCRGLNMRNRCQGASSQKVEVT
jgi:hypothetical protein